MENRPSKGSLPNRIISWGILRFGIGTYETYEAYLSFSKRAGRTPEQAVKIWQNFNAQKARNALGEGDIGSCESCEHYIEQAEIGSIKKDKPSVREEIPVWKAF